MQMLSRNSNIKICHPLGYPDSYLDGFEERFPDSFKFLNLKLETPSKSVGPWLSRPAYYGATEDEFGDDNGWVVRKGENSLDTV